ncbi:MAG: histidinol-phosphate transaminase [Methylobacteriaceae bacterium]|nr:histidinol-phosphate transaminase [Methylobacteriaceae bacterium]
MNQRGFIRPAVDRIPAFGGVPTCDTAGMAGQAFLHLNECPYPPSPRVVEAITHGAAGVNRYGEPRPQLLAERLAQLAGVEADRIVIGNGSDEVLAMIASATLEAGDVAVAPTPSFPRYRISAAIQGAQTRLVKLLLDGRNDVAGLLGAIDGATRVVYCCTPNNPSGAPLEPEEIAHLCERVPADVLLVVDEAYAEFHRHEGGVDALPALARRNGPWASVRTFSKAYALAGLRLGYAIVSDGAIAAALTKVKLNFNLSRIAVQAGLAALDDKEYADGLIAAMVVERERLAGSLAAMGFAPLPSRANFVSFDLRRPAMPVMAAMARRGVLVREWRDPGYETYIRFSVGLPAENDRAVAALRLALGEA